MASTIVIYIVSWLKDAQAAISRTRLQKLLYLCDVEHFRTYRRTLTGLTWLFLHYGPYSAELQEATEELVQADELEERPIASTRGRIAYTYSDRGELERYREDLERQIGRAGMSSIERVLDRWALEDLNRLLDFVYFETEPMQPATRGQALDFTNIQPRPVQEPINSAILSPNTIKRLKEQMSEARRSRKASKPTPPPLDDVYDAAIQLMREQEKNTPVVFKRAPVSGP